MPMAAGKRGKKRRKTSAKTPATKPKPEPLPHTTLRARGSGVVAGGLSSIPQKHGGALLPGGKPGHKGANQYTGRQRAQDVRGRLIVELEGVAGDLSALLETARESDGDRLRCKACGSFIPGVSKLELSDILAVIRELRAVLPTQMEHEGLPSVTVQVVAGVQVVPNRVEES